MTAYEVGEWSEFFVAAAGASAALAGLVFVAVSINVERILKFEGLPERALATVLMLLAVVLLSLAALIPDQSTHAVGAEVLGLGLAFGIATLVLVSREPAEGKRLDLSRFLVVAVGFVPIAIGGVSVLAESGGGLYWVAAGLILTTSAAVLNAWVLLVEILR
jgi:modulator of FtsH protease